MHINKIKNYLSTCMCIYTYVHMNSSTFCVKQKGTNVQKGMQNMFLSLCLFFSYKTAVILCLVLLVPL